MTGRPDNYFTMFVGDYLRDTMHLTTRQHGAYQLLLMHYYGTGRPLPLDEGTLRTITRELPADWKVDRGPVMAFFKTEGDGWHQKRADKELSSANVRYERAIKGAAAKHGHKQRSSTRQAGAKQPLKDSLGNVPSTENVAYGLLNGCSNDANPLPTATQVGPTGLPCDSSARQAAPARAAAPVALGDLAEKSEKWRAFAEKLGPAQWHSTGLGDCTLDGSETAVLAASPFAATQLEHRFEGVLEEHFEGRVRINFNPEKWNPKGVRA